MTEVITAVNSRFHPLFLPEATAAWRRERIKATHEPRLTSNMIGPEAENV